MSQTLILDEDGVYDPSHFNDRLLLGLKGAMSEAELHILKARLQGGILNKAKRGELKIPLPIGLVYQSDEAVILDPDSQIRQTMSLLFDTFRERQSAMAVVKRFHQEGLKFPRRIRCGIGKGDLLWGEVNHSRVLQILHNPTYAGAFVYGRCRGARTAELRPTMLRVPQKDWQVLIKNAHTGYISWQEFERNQAVLRSNAGGFGQMERGKMPREGAGLLQGRVLCGRCGSRMRVRYQCVSDKRLPYYQCNEQSVRHAGKLCQSIHGSGIDKAISQVLLQTLTPEAIQVALAVQEEIAQRIQHAEALREKQLQRARYNTELSRRRYLAVDPDNRLVASTLEAGWNEQLRTLDSLQREFEKRREADRTLLADQVQKQIKSLASDFPRLWHDSRTSAKQRKGMIALLIEDVTLIKADQITVHIRFRGGRTQTLKLDLPVPMSRIRKTPDEVVKTVDHLLQTCTDKVVANQLNQRGYHNWQGQGFSAKKVALIRSAYGLKSRHARLRAQGLLTGDEMAERLDVSATTIHTWGRQGLLKRELYGNNTRYLYFPVDSTEVTKGQGGRRATQPQFMTA